MSNPARDDICADKRADKRRRKTFARRAHGAHFSAARYTLIPNFIRNQASGDTVAIYKLGDDAPTIDESVFLADTATIIGRVTLEQNTSVWFGATLRGDNEPIVVGTDSNVQEGAVLHADPGFPLTIGEGVTIGHQAMLHGCTIGDGSLIGIQAVVLNGAVIGRNCLVGAGALVTEGKQFPDNSVILGSPAKAVRQVTDADIARMRGSAASYTDRREFYKAQLQRIG
jgi:carbonic anhydrase/acetyltransferase-like protein (isoleucine patch superfamily)